MYRVSRFIVVITALMAVGCAHRIDITPPLNTLQATSAAKINKTVGYYISEADKAKEVTTPGGGGDRVTYQPYKESEPALNQVLSNIYVKVIPIRSLDDKK